MALAHPELIPETPPDRDEMRRLQTRVAELARWQPPDSFDPGTARLAGIDQAFGEDTVTSAAVVWEDGDILDEAVATVEDRFPYVPGYLAFREAPAMVAVLDQLTVAPDALLVDGNGRLHPRSAGLATHVGVAAGMPAVGVAKGLLCGVPDRALDEKLSPGTRIIVRNEERTPIGAAVQTRQWSSAERSINPLFVSPGHRMDLETAIEVVEWSCRGYKLPEPIRAADAVADGATGRG